MKPSLGATDPYGVALIGEALGADEAAIGSPFVGKAGFRLTRLIEWAGFERAKFDIYNTVWCRPPLNNLENTPYELPAIAHCRARHWGSLLDRARVIVPMGNVALGAFIERKGILTARGYVYQHEGRIIVPTVHPSFIQRGNSKWSAPFINDLQKAVGAATNGLPYEFTRYVLDPSPAEAYEWGKEYLRSITADPSLRCSFDIETPYKGEDEDDLDTDSDAPDRSWHIERIGFAYRPFEAISFPWAPEYIPAIRLILGSRGEKVVWNAGFDVPRIKRAGVRIEGLVHDGMVAWHVLHSDLPKRLAFVATFTCPFQPAWKHLSSAKPAFYNATDNDVQLRSMLAIERDLRANDLWAVYDRDVLQLQPILDHMSEKGMPIDASVREDRAKRLSQLLKETHNGMETTIPIECRRIACVYKRPPQSLVGLFSRRATATVNLCTQCGVRAPRKDHFKTFIKKSNPCAGAGVREATEEVDEYYRLAPFTPSRDQLSRYHRFLSRPLPMTLDKKIRQRKVSFGEKQLKELQLKYPLDELYALVLQYRSFDKIAGSYLGRPNAD